MISIEKIFDKSSKTYDKTEEKDFFPIHIKTIEKTKNYLNKNDTVLDYGCATGTKALELSRYVKKIEAIDISTNMIELAKKKAEEYKNENINFIKTTLEDSKYEQESFDVIMAFSILHLLENREKIMAKINNLLKPGGIFISVTTCLDEKKTQKLGLQFLPYKLLSRLGLFPFIKLFKFKELENLISGRDFQIIKKEIFFYKMSFLFIVARKI